MLKTLLGPLPPEGLLRVLRQEYRNASELAAAAEVAVMSAFGFVRPLKQEGFLDDRDEPLPLVRRKEPCDAGRPRICAARPSFPCVGSFRSRARAGFQRRFTPIAYSPT